MTPTREEILKVLRDNKERFAEKYGVTKLGLFGSFARNEATEGSDLDLLVEFIQPNVSLWTISSLKCDLEDELNMPVDVIHAPLPQKSIIKIGKTIPVYERT
jgi:predicted nucleotidyltransferase